jgi:hypothetical protein
MDAQHTEGNTRCQRQGRTKQPSHHRRYEKDEEEFDGKIGTHILSVTRRRAPRPTTNSDPA